MISIEQNGSDWVVMHDGEAASVHPSREEAERAVEWLMKNRDLRPRDDPAE